jgi:hypothetical protein
MLHELEHPFVRDRVKGHRHTLPTVRTSRSGSPSLALITPL